MTTFPPEFCDAEGTVFFRNKCYTKFDGLYIFEDATQKCRQEGGQLATSKDADVNAVLKGLRG